MKRIAFIIALALFVLFAGLWTYVQSNAFATRIRPLIAAPLQEVLGTGASIGWVKASLLPFYLEVRDITIPSPGNREAIAIRRVRLYVNPFPLLYGTISLSSVAVLEPRIMAGRSPDGTVDLAELIGTIRSNLEKRKSTGSTTYAVQIHTITVRNGKVVLSDAGTKTTVTVSRLNLKMKMNLPNASFNVRLASGDLTIAAPAFRDIKGQARGIINYDQGRLSLDKCELASEDTRLTAEGTVGVMTGGGLDLKLTARMGQRILGRITDIFAGKKRTKGPVIQSTTRISGTVKDPIMSGSIVLSDISIRGMRLQDAETRFAYRNGYITIAAEQWKLSKGSQQISVQEISLEASYQGGRLRIGRSDILADDLSVNATGTVGPAEGYQLALSARSTEQGRSLSFFSGFEITGAAAVHGALSGPLAAPHFDGKLEAGPVSVRGVPFRRVGGSLIFEDRILSLDDADIRHGSSVYAFYGSVNFRGPEPLFQAKLDVRRSDVVSIVALFYKRIPLDLSATGELSFHGTRKDFSGTGHLDLDAGVAYGESFDRGSLSVELTNNRVSFPRVILEKKTGSVTGEGWIGFDGTYEAHVEGEGLDLAEVDHLKKLDCSGEFVLDIRSSGSFSAPSVQAHAETGQLSYRQTALGPARVDLEIQKGELALAAEVGDGIFSTKGAWKLKHPYTWTTTASLRLSEVDPSALFTGSDFLAKARVMVEGSVKARGNGLDLDSIAGTAQFQKLGFTIGDLRLENDGAADIRIDGGRVVVRSLTLSGAGTKVAVTGGTYLGKDLDLSFAGDANLSLLRVLYREIEHGDGIASVKLSVSDEWSNPEIAGELTIRNGLIKIRDIPQKFTALNGTISFTRDKVATETLSGEVGGGTINVSGNAQLDGSKLVDLSTKASIENVTVRYPPGLTATLGGVLYFDGDASTQTLSGEIAIQKARYEKRIEWKSMLVDFSKGFGQKRKADIGWIGETQLNVRFTGKESILFESNLAKIPLDVDMLFRGTVNQPQVLGRIEARKGEVYFRKNVFRILHASADFTDPKRINPMLDIQGETRVREYQIQLGVSGTADRAIVTYASDPPLSDANILNILAVGKTSEELKGKELNVGVGEATSFATGKFQDIIESHARTLTGLDRFQVDPYISKTDTAVPRITVGKELVQEKVFLTYSSNVGATTPEQVFRIEYILNRNMSLVGDRNEVGNLGADVKFRFEFR
ncbi:MAG: AsmA family protein [Nitrospirae bacterium]|nr:AsmA family protein [Nitrospirota bacterium]NTW65749.1 AsmA family protein [Nitrospirota bacterium]